MKAHETTKADAPLPPQSFPKETKKRDLKHPGSVDLKKLL
jgi:hypothetical protein